MSNTVKIYTKESVLTNFSKAIWSEKFEDYYGLMLGIPQLLTQSELLQKGYVLWNYDDDAYGDGHGIDTDTMTDAVYEACERMDWGIELNGVFSVYMNGDGHNVFVCMDKKCTCIVVPFYAD